MSRRGLLRTLVLIDIAALLIAVFLLSRFGEGFSFILGVLVAQFVPALLRDITRLRRRSDNG